MTCEFWMPLKMISPGLIRAVAQRIISRIQWLAEHFDEINPNS
jgi:hypothetical protein